MTQGDDALELYSKEVIIPVAVQSCRLIPALLLPPADPAGDEAPEGSSLFRPGVEARSAEDPGKRRRIQGIRPRQGVALSSLLRECDTLPGSYLL